MVHPTKKSPSGTASTRAHPPAPNVRPLLRGTRPRPSPVIYPPRSDDPRVEHADGSRPQAVSVRTAFQFQVHGIEILADLVRGRCRNGHRERQPQRGDCGHRSDHAFKFRHDDTGAYPPGNTSATPATIFGFRHPKDQQESRSFVLLLAKHSTSPYRIRSPGMPGP
jgi:hypothetical protein